MIIKVMSRKSSGRGYRSLIEYMEKHLPERTEPFFTQNLRGQGREDWVREFEANEQNRKHKRKDAVKLFHHVISWHEKDTAALDEDALRQFSHEYAKALNPNALMVCEVHRDTKSRHLHCMVSASESSSGKGTRLSKAQLRDLKLHMEEWQKEHYPEIKHSTVEHGKGGHTISDGEYRVRARNGTTTKEELKEKVSIAFEKALSRDEFLALVKEDGFEPYYRNERLTGILVDGTKYRFTTLEIEPEYFQELDEREAQLKELETLRSPKEEAKELALPEAETELPLNLPLEVTEEELKRDALPIVSAISQEYESEELESRTLEMELLWELENQRSTYPNLDLDKEIG